MLGRSENTIDITLHALTKPRGAAEDNVGSNDQFVNNLAAEALAYIEEDGEEDEDDKNYVDDACLWHDPFLDRHNLEMEIPDDCVQLV